MAESEDDLPDERDPGEEAAPDIAAQQQAQVDRRQAELPPLARSQPMASLYGQPGGAPTPPGGFAAPPPPPTEPSGGQFAPDSEAYGQKPQSMVQEPAHWAGKPEYEKNWLRAHPEQDYQQNRFAIEAETGRKISEAINKNPVAMGAFLERQAPQMSFQQNYLPDDPQKQAAVKERENALDQIEHDDSLSPDQKKIVGNRLREQINALDQQGVYRRGGLKSQQTEAEKWFAQKTVRDPQTGALIGLDSKGQPHVLHKGLDPGELALKKLDIESKHAEAKLRLDELTLKNKNEKERHEREQAAKLEKAKQDAEAHAAKEKRLDEEHYAKRLNEHEKFLFGGEEGLPEDKKTSAEERRRQAVERDRATMFAKRFHAGEIKAPGDQAATQRLYDDVYAYLHSGKKMPTKNVGEELRNRHQATADFLRDNGLLQRTLESGTRTAAKMPPASVIPPTPPWVSYGR